jgi:hypothetical protein
MSENAEVVVRLECLQPAEQWERPSAAEVQQTIRRTGLSGRAVARALGIGEEGRNVRRWGTGESQIPYTAWAVLCQMAGLGIIWEPKPGSQS